MLVLFLATSIKLYGIPSSIFSLSTDGDGSAKYPNRNCEITASRIDIRSPGKIIAYKISNSRHNDMSMEKKPNKGPAAINYLRRSRRFFLA